MDSGGLSKRHCSYVLANRDLQTVFGAAHDWKHYSIPMELPFVRSTDLELGVGSLVVEISGKGSRKSWAMLDVKTGLRLLEAGKE